MTVLRIGTRGSALALWQARTVAALIEASGAADTELVIIKTDGDRLQSAPLSEIGGKRLFVKEIEDALLRGEIDVAVHSAKDMSVDLPEGLVIAAVLPREDSRDALVLRDETGICDFDAALDHLGEQPAIGTGSIRRMAQLAARLPGAVFSDIRGNVDTRLRKLDTGGFDALVLAAAGMLRLGAGSRISAHIPIEVCVPAPGQGIVAIEVRSDDGRTRAVIEPLGDPAAAMSLTAERAVVRALGGGCQLPLGAIALHENGGLRMHGAVASADGTRVIRCEVTGTTGHPADAGRALADELARAGAGDILDAVRHSGLGAADA
ncbi:MAG: hydroxymethylbilane synthase [Acidobacteriota bacterium]